MGKLIRMGAQERRSLWPKRLHWSRPLFLLGMLIIGSTYQYLTSPQGLPTLWAAVSSQHPVKVASRDLSNKEMMTVSSETSKSSSEMEVEAWAPEATAGRDGTTSEPPGKPRNVSKCMLVARSCLTLCNPMGCSLPGSSIVPHYLSYF